MQLTFNPKSLDDYRTFLRVKQLPRYAIRGRVASFPDEYASRLGVPIAPSLDGGGYQPCSWMFDYQRDMMRTILRKQKFALFWDCGLGKTPMILEYAREVCDRLRGKKGVLIVSPLMVVSQTIAEAKKFFGEQYPVKQVTANSLSAWLLNCEGEIGITNYDAITDDLKTGNLGCLILDESSMLKSHYGKWATKLIDLGKGLEWKLCLTGTPAPNDRIEYANHAVFLDEFPNVNSFLARYFVNRGQTNERWEIRPHALRPFYTAMSHWAHFLTKPSTYGWTDNARPLPPIDVQIHEVELTDAQKQLIGTKSGELFVTNLGGIVGRSAYGAISKGFYTVKSADGKSSSVMRVESNKPAFIRSLTESWQGESCIHWCGYNEEQDILAEQFPDAANLTGTTANWRRLELIDEFKRGERTDLISKAKIIGFGLNLQVATRQVFSCLQDSYESYYQCVKRSNRYGSTKPLRVHIPITDVEAPMVENVLQKAKRVQQDTEEQEQLFKEGLQWA